MDKVDAYFAMVGFLTTAYLLSYPVDWLIMTPISWCFLKLHNANERLARLNAELDLMYGESLRDTFRASLQQARDRAAAKTVRKNKQ